MVGKIEKKTMRNNQIPLQSFSLECCVLMDIVHDRVIRTALAKNMGEHRLHARVARKMRRNELTTGDMGEGIRGEEVCGLAGESLYIFERVIVYRRVEEYEVSIPKQFETINYAHYDRDPLVKEPG